MSDTASSATTLLPTVSPVTGAVQMFAAPVDVRGAGPRVFDPARQGRFPLSTPPAGWYAMGTVLGIEREDLGTFAEVWSGAPAVLRTRARSGSAATLQCSFAGWSKLAMALSSGSQQMNLLRTTAAYSPADSGGTPDSAALLGGSTESVLRVPVSFSVNAGDLIAVDEDYAGQTGYVGAPIAGAYLQSAERVGNEAHYLRRLTYNLARVVRVYADATAQTLTLASPLPAGVPSGTMRIGVVEGFTDRVGGTFLSEWSVLLVADGVLGDRILLHYPRLQTVGGGTTETRDALVSGFDRWRLRAKFVTLPVTDSNDGDAVLCYRSYLPAAASTL